MIKARTKNSTTNNFSDDVSGTTPSVGAHATGELLDQVFAVHAASEIESVGGGLGYSAPNTCHPPTSNC